MNKVSKYVTAIVGCVAAISAGVAGAVPSYGNIVAPGVYFGSGNVNGNFTIDTSNNIEVALRAKERDGAQATINGSSGVYQANPGTCGGGIGCGGATKARWNYEFSINTQAGGGALTLQNVFAQMAVDTDPGVGVNYTVLNVFTNWPDNDYWSGSERSGLTGPPAPGEYGVQQSVNPLFGNSGFMPGFNPFADGLYDLQLSVFSNVAGAPGALLAQTHTAVRVGAGPAAVPEPSTLWLLGLTMLGLGVAARRKSI
jgi:hypothetical protein